MFTKLSAFNVLIWTACLAIVGAMVAGLVILFGPVDVLRNWNMSVGGENKTFAVGQVVYFESESEKLMSVEGRADRYLVCDAKGNYIEREVAISPVELKRPAGMNTLRKNSFDMPLLQAFNDEQGNSTLPRVCKLHINACYPVYGFRTHCEQAETEKFTVVATLDDNSGDNSNDVRDIQSTSTSGSQTQQQSQQQAPVPQNSQNSSTTNNTTNNETIVVNEPACTIDTNLLGLIPIKLGCQ